MSYLIAITDNYISSSVDRSGGQFTVGDSLYLTTDTLEVTNNVADGLTTLGQAAGVIGTCQEAPDLNVSGDRLVIRLEEDDDLLTPIMRLLQAVTV